MLLTKRECELVSNSFLFHGVCNISLEYVIRSECCMLKVFERGHNIYTPTSFMRCAGFILSGEVKVTRPGHDAQSYLLNTLKTGDYFGVAALWSKDNEYVTVLTAARRCRILFFTQELLRSLMSDDFTIAENYIRFLSGRIRFLNEKIQALTLGNCEQTLAAHLSALIPFSNSRTIDCGSISSLALKLNVGRSSLYRAFDSLADSGIIRKNGRMVEILDENALSNIIGGNPK